MRNTTYLTKCVQRALRRPGQVSGKKWTLITFSTVVRTLPMVRGIRRKVRVDNYTAIYYFCYLRKILEWRWRRKMQANQRVTSKPAVRMCSTNIFKMANIGWLQFPQFEQFPMKNGNGFSQVC